MVKNDSLTPKGVKGKKVRCRSFYSIWFFVIVFTAVLVGYVLSGIIEQMSFETIKILLWITIPVLLVIILPLALFNIFRNSSPVCVLAKDRLYFFDSDTVEFDPKNPKKEKHAHTSGSVAYSEINDIKYIPPIRKFRSSQLVLKGNGFEIAIYDLAIWVIIKINNARKIRCNIKNTICDEEAVSYVREGIWNDLWEANQSGQIEKIFDEHTEILRIISDETSDMLDIDVCRNGIEICFNLDESRVYMCVPNTEAEDTVFLSDFDSTEGVFEKMREFVVRNSNKA